MSTISSYSFSQMTDLVKRSFTKRLETVPQIMRNSWFVITDVLWKNTGDSRRYAERIHRNKFAWVRDEWGSAPQALVQYGYEKDATVYTVALTVSITKRMRDAGKDQSIIDSITDLSDVCPATIDLDLAHRLTFATSTSYVRTAWGTSTTIDLTVWDGLALVSAVHTLTGSTTTYTNIIPGNPLFSKAALENGERLFVEETYNNLGEKMYMKADTIMTTDDPTTINQVRELLNSQSNVDTSNSSTFNVYKNAYKHIMSGNIATDANWNPDSTKRGYWFLIASDYSDFYLTMLNEPYLKTPMDGNNGEEFSTENWNYLTACDYDSAIVTGKWIKASTGLWN